MRDMKVHTCKSSLWSLIKEKLVSTVATILRQRWKASVYLLHGRASLTVIFKVYFEI